MRVADLAARFGVDAATIRRDLKVLGEHEKVRRVHGGAVAVEGGAAESPVHWPATPAERIGHAAAGMIADAETVFLGPGRIVLEAARGLAQRSGLTIVTNGLEVAHWVAAHTSHNLIVTGGQAERRDLALVGQLTREALATLRADHVILELGGISLVGELTHDSLPQAEMARRLLEIGGEVIVVASAERVGRIAAAYVAPVSDVDVIVTAREAPAPVLWDLSESGVRIVLA